MLPPLFVASTLAGLILLFFSVHLYMDIRMFRRKGIKRGGSGFPIPLWARGMAFIPSFVFWIVFLASPFLLLYDEVYERVFEPFLFESDLLQVTGLILLLAGVLLADWGRVSRGVIAPSQAMPEGYRLAKKGAYGVVRHPMYVSYCLFFVGLPLALLNALLFVTLFGIPGYCGIAKAEEEILLKRFGDEYRDYQEEVGMFFPKVMRGKMR